MSEPRFVARLSEIGLFRGLAKSKPTMMVVTALLVGASVGYGLFSADFVENRSSSVTLNLFLLTGQFMLMVVGGYIGAMLVASFIFGDEWRERVLVGVEQELEEEDEDIEAAFGESGFKDHTFAFYGLMLAAIFGIFSLTMGLTDNYFQRYNDHGFFLTKLRSDDPEDRIAVLRQLVNPLHVDSANDDAVFDAIALACEDPDPEVRTWAAWAAGHIGVPQARPALTTMLEQGGIEEQIEAAHALGRLRDPVGERIMIAMLSSSIGDTRLSQALMTGLGLMRSQDAAEPIASMLGLYPPELEPIAFWAIGEARTTEFEVRGAVISFYDDVQGDLARHCGLAEALQHVTTVEDKTWMIETFEELPIGEECEPLMWEERRFLDDTPMRGPVYVSDDELREKYLVAIFNVGGPDTQEWLEYVAWKEDESDSMKVRADELAGILRERGPMRPRE